MEGERDQRDLEVACLGLGGEEEGELGLLMFWFPSSGTESVAGRGGRNDVGGGGVTLRDPGTRMAD